MRGRAMQALYLLALDPIAETQADPNSYGFRTPRAPADAIEQGFNALAKKASPQWVQEGDIRACFDEFSHNWLWAHIPMDKAILSKWLKAGYMEGNVLHPTEAGTPQGGIGSPVIANLALDGLEARLRTAFPRDVWNGRQQVCPKVNFIRLADDFVITGATKELLEDEVKPWVEAFLKERGLPLSAEKTVIMHLADGFDFLGQNIRKYNGKLRIKPSAKSIKTVLRKVRTVIKDNKSAAAGSLICQLNPVIRGWAMYHRHALSAKVFQSVDDAIFQALWRWAKRRHPNKVFKALQVLRAVESDLEDEEFIRGNATARKLYKAVSEFTTYIENHRGFIPNYGERYRSGERISTGFAESTVNQVVSKRRVKKQQMRWSQRGGHLLLQIRTRVLNGEWEETFRPWYPGFRTERQPALA
jgi:group II intron reverse transcriptase/maturase